MKRHKIFGLLFLFVALVVLTACSGGGSQSNQPVEVQVTADDFSFQSSLTTFEVGVPYHFVVTNEGTVEHEFMIVQPIEAGTMDMEAMDQMALAHIEEDDLPAGGTATVDYTFTEPAPAGTLEFSCHLAGHYENGMRLPITVQ
jgi:uncharacterized cupredoxin-like copper-binding protein